MSRTRELIEHVVNKKPTEFGALLDEMLSEAAVEALNERRIEIAESLYSENTEEDEESEQDTE